jgi:hypothetical protein
MAMTTISMILISMASATSHATSSRADQHRVTNLPGIDLTTLINATHFSGYISVNSDLAALNAFYYYVQNNNCEWTLQQNPYSFGATSSGWFQPLHHRTMLTGTTPHLLVQI